MTRGIVEPTKDASLSDEQVVGRVRAGEVDLYEVLMRRYNQRVYRISRAVLGDAAEAEDVAQEAWVRAYAHLGQFEGRSTFSTWIGRIAFHEACARARKQRRFESIESEAPGEEGKTMKPLAAGPDPESEAFGREMTAFVESAIEALPESYRIVFTLRQVEELSTEETAECLELSEEAVKTRLHRARAALRRNLLERAGGGIRSAFPFLGYRCDRLVAAVLGRIRRVEIS